MNKQPVKYCPEVRERAVWRVLEHQDEHDSQWAAIASIAAKIGCTADLPGGGGWACAGLSAASQ